MDPWAGVEVLLAAIRDASSDAEVLALLEVDARVLVEADLAHRLAPLAQRLSALDYTGRSEAGLAAGVAAISHDRSRGLQILENARTEFEMRGDADGAGLCCFLLGNEEVGAGNLEAAEQLFAAARALSTTGAIDAFTIAHQSLGAYQRGDLAGAIGQAEHALHLGRVSGNDRAVGVAGVYLALFRWWTGDFTGMETAANTAAQAFTTIREPRDRFESAMVFSANACLAAQRGDVERAEAEFARAIDEASMVDEWLVAIARTLRAEVMVRADLHRSMADAAAALAYFERVGEQWWTAWARQAMAIAACEAGDFTASELALREVLALDLGPLEHGRALLTLGQTMSRRGEARSARRYLTEAVEQLAKAGATYWAARAEVCLAAVDPKRTEYLLRSALTRAEGRADDPAWRRMLRGEARIEVHVLGAPFVVVDGKRVVFTTRATLLAVCMLALAGSAGLHDEVIIERLWPDVDADRSKHRLDNVLSAVRHALLPSTPVRRFDGRVVLDLDVDQCDLHALERRIGQIAIGGRPSHEAIAEVVGRLRNPVVGGAYDDWVLEAQSDVDQLVAQLEAVVPPAA